MKVLRKLLKSRKC